MSTAFEKLRELVPPPAEPYEAQGDWDAVEAQVGSPLPEDYKAFVSAYGTGVVSKLFYTYNPFAKNRNLNLLAYGERIVDAYRTMVRHEHPLEIPYPVYPEPGGLLPWGRTENTFDLFWVARGEPDQWFVFCCNARDDEWFAFEGESACSFMEGLISKRIRSAAFRRRWFSRKPGFRTITYNPADAIPECVITARTPERVTYDLGGKISLEIPIHWKLREPSVERNEIFAVEAIASGRLAGPTGAEVKAAEEERPMLRLTMREGGEGKAAQEVAEDDLARYVRADQEGSDEDPDKFRLLDKGSLEGRSGDVPCLWYQQYGIVFTLFYWVQGDLVYRLWGDLGRSPFEHWRPEFEAVARSVRLLG